MLVVGLIGTGYINFGTGASALAGWIPSSVFSAEAIAPLASEVTPEVTPEAPQPEVLWTYDFGRGPDHWSELDSHFATCSNGQAQSPINLTGAEAADLLNPEFHYQPAPLNLLNNGHTVQVPYAPGSYLVLEGERYDLRQFHFHSPSEHAIDSQSQVAELHLVHQNEAGELAVVAVLMRADDTQATDRDYTDVSENLPMQAGDKVRTEKWIDATALLPEQMTTYRYSGSLTTPPCTESVTWLVMSTPIGLPTEQLLKYEGLLNHNNRPLQLSNGRSVQIDATP